MATPTPILAQKPDIPLIKKRLATPTAPTLRIATTLATLATKGLNLSSITRLDKTIAKTAWTVAILYAAVLGDTGMLDGLKARATTTIEGERTAEHEKMAGRKDRMPEKAFGKATAKIDAEATRKLAQLDFELPKVELPANARAFLAGNKDAILEGLESDQKQGRAAKDVGDQAEVDGFDVYRSAINNEGDIVGTNILIQADKGIKAEIDFLVRGKEGAVVGEVKANWRSIFDDIGKLRRLLEKAAEAGIVAKDGKILVPPGSKVTATYMARQGEHPASTLTEVMVPGLINAAAGKMAGQTVEAIFGGADIELRVENGRVHYTPPPAVIESHVTSIAEQIAQAASLLASGLVTIYLF